MALFRSLRFKVLQLRIALLSISRLNDFWLGEGFSWFGVCSWLRLDARNGRLRAFSLRVEKPSCIRVNPLSRFVASIHSSGKDRTVASLENCQTLGPH